MSRTAVTPIFLAAMLGTSLRSIERMIDAEDLPAPSQKYPREWAGGDALAALAASLVRMSNPAARAASAVIERLTERDAI
jgi:hypothetical protein